jgi:hypothetical protein
MYPVNGAKQQSVEVYVYTSVRYSYYSASQIVNAAPFGSEMLPFIEFLTIIPSPNVNTPVGLCFGIFRIADKRSTCHSLRMNKLFVSVTLRNARVYGNAP